MNPQPLPKRLSSSPQVKTIEQRSRLVVHPPGVPNRNFWPTVYACHPRRRARSPFKSIHPSAPCIHPPSVHLPRHRAGNPRCIGSRVYTQRRGGHSVEAHLIKLRRGHVRLSFVRLSCRSTPSLESNELPGFFRELRRGGWIFEPVSGRLILFQLPSSSLAAATTPFWRTRAFLRRFLLGRRECRGKMKVRTRRGCSSTVEIPFPGDSFGKWLRLAYLNLMLLSATQRNCVF